MKNSGEKAGGGGVSWLPQSDHEEADSSRFGRKSAGKNKNVTFKVSDYLDDEVNNDEPKYQRVSRFTENNEYARSKSVN